MQETINYIIQFILGDHVSPETASLVGYTADANDRYKIIIKPSDFFDSEFYGTPESLPKTPLKIWEETPILYGNPTIERTDNQLVIHADIVASSYFLMSRYEEIIRRNVRDVHGRFPGKESLPYRAGFIDRPLIEEYGKLLRAFLRETGVDVDEPPHKIRKVYLTHDVDQLAHFRSIRSMLGGVLRGIKRPKEGQKALKSYFGSLRNDPWYTFPFLFKVDNELKSKLGSDRCETIAFIRSSGRKYKEDKPFPNLIHPDYKNLIRYCKRKDISFGLHSSYEAGINPELILAEKNKLEKLARLKTSYNRNHFLNNRHPEDMQFLIDAGITDDFSLGYADMAGFRLGTCRPLKWINPVSMKVTELCLHGLTIMDRTLDDKRYMYMNSHDAYQYCVQLIDCIESYNGELSLLWHNNSVEKTPQSYHRKLYVDLLKHLSEKSEKGE